MAGRSMDEAPSKRWRKHMDENGLRKRALWVPKEHADEAECIHHGHSNPSPLRIFLDPFEGVLFLPVGGRHADHCLTRKGTSSPASLLQQAFEILPVAMHKASQLTRRSSRKRKRRRPCQSLASAKRGSTQTLRLFRAFW